MAVYSEEAEKKALQQVAELMCLAARTAPKGRGVDRIETIILNDKSDLNQLTTEMKAVAQRFGEVCAFFHRDALNIERTDGPVVLIGTTTGTMGLSNCGYCGFADCAELIKAGGVCAIATNDLGIAIGSAVSVAAQHKADNRVMFSVGRTAVKLKLFKSNVSIAYGIPLNASGKNPFFDRT